MRKLHLREPVPLQLDLSVLNNLLASGINKNSNSSNENCESDKTNDCYAYNKRKIYLLFYLILLTTTSD